MIEIASLHLNFNLILLWSWTCWRFSASSGLSTWCTHSLGVISTSHLLPASSRKSFQFPSPTPAELCVLPVHWVCEQHKVPMAPHSVCCFLTCVLHKETPSKIHMLRSSSPMLGGGACRRWLGSEEAMRVSPVMMGLVPCKRGGEMKWELPAMWGLVKRQPARLQARRGLSPEPHCAGTLILDFSASRSVKNKFLLFNPL